MLSLQYKNKGCKTSSHKPIKTQIKMKQAFDEMDMYLATLSDDELNEFINSYMTDLYPNDSVDENFSDSSLLMTD